MSNEPAQEREQWHVYEARFGPSGYSWCDVMCNNRVVARCSNRADADAIVAAHNGQPSAWVARLHQGHWELTDGARRFPISDELGEAWGNPQPSAVEAKAAAVLEWADNLIDSGFLWGTSWQLEYELIGKLPTTPEQQ